jgi:hypothetical protein
MGVRRWVVPVNFMFVFQKSCEFQVYKHNGCGLQR